MLDIHGLMSKSHLLLWVLADSVVSRAKANMSAVSTFLRKGMRISLVNICEDGQDGLQMAWKELEPTPQLHAADDPIY